MAQTETYFHGDDRTVAFRDRLDRDTCVGAGRIVDAFRGVSWMEAPIDVPAVLQDADVLPENQAAAMAEALGQLHFFASLPPADRKAR